MIDINKWMQAYEQAVMNAFGGRVLFIGLQGSYGRNEASESSDIDVVLILNSVDIEDLKIYKEITRQLPYRERLCGFVSGRDEISNWSRADLFQFYRDTLAVWGSLEELLPPLGDIHARQAVLTGACGIYHACSHNFLHAMDAAALSALYKSAFFVLQAKLYCENEKYIRSRMEMRELARGEDLDIFQISSDSSLITPDTLEQYTQKLLAWSGKLICSYGDHR